MPFLFRPYVYKTVPWMIFHFNSTIYANLKLDSFCIGKGINKSKPQLLLQNKFKYPHIAGNHFQPIKTNPWTSTYNFNVNTLTLRVTTSSTTSRLTSLTLRKKMLWKTWKKKKKQIINITIKLWKYNIGQQKGKSTLPIKWLSFFYHDSWTAE